MDNKRSFDNMLGSESDSCFELKHFEDMVLGGAWNEAVDYFVGFTKDKDHSCSIKLCFEMRQQQYFEALDKNHRHKALNILLKNLKVLAQGDEGLIKDLSYLLTVDNIREIKPAYQDTLSARRDLIIEFKKSIIQHPILIGKVRIKLPIIQSPRLHHLPNKSIISQPYEKPHILMDHGSGSNSKPSAPGVTISGTTKEWKPSTNERPNMDSVEADYNLIQENVKPHSIEDSQNESSHCHFLKLPMSPEVTKIARVTYTNAGNSIVALASNGIHLVWLWPRSDSNLHGKASAHVCPRLWQPKEGPQFMKNELSSGDTTTRKTSHIVSTSILKYLPHRISENPVSCFALPKRDGCVISTSGGTVSLFSMATFETLRTVMSPPPMVTCLAFYPEDNNIIGIGFADSTILIHNVRHDKVLHKLEGHSKRVTTLAFSNASNILISGDANAQIIMWNTNGWEKLKDRHVQMQVSVSDIEIQFHPDQINFLVVNESYLAIYEATELTCVNQWVPNVPKQISKATFSCDGHIVYSIFADRTVAIFDASNFQICCKLNATCYLPPVPSWIVYPISIAAHPQKPTQFVLGLSDGSVYVFEPREPRSDWIKSN